MLIAIDNRLGRTPPDCGRRNGQPGKPLVVESDFLLRLRRAALPAGEFGRRRRSRRPSLSHPARSCPRPPSRLMATSTSSATLPRPSAAQGRRRLPAGIALALRQAFNRGGARQDLAAWIAKWGSRYPKLVNWVEETIEETLTFYRLPRQHHKHLKSTNMLERFNEEIRRRTYVVRIFPNSNACCRLIRARSRRNP